MVVLPSQLKKTKTTVECKASKFKVSPYIHQSNKTKKSNKFESMVVASKNIIEVKY